MKPDPPVEVLYCENNVDGTIGGSYYSLLYLVKNLDRQRYHPIVIFYTEHALLPAYQEAGVETYVWEKAKTFTFGSLNHRFWRWLRPIRPIALLLQKALNFVHEFLVPAVVRAWYIKRKGVKIVHLNNSILYNHDWMFAAKLAGARCVTHERGINDRFTASAKYFGKRLDAVICISEAVRRNMHDRGADFGNLVVVHNGLDPDSMKMKIRPDALRAVYEIEPETVVVGMVGNIKSWKGQDTVVRAIDRVRRAFPSVRCVLVGDTSPSDKDYERSLHELVASLGLEKHVIFTGFQRHVGDFLMMFDVVVHASVLPEPFGRVILEAMACKKPVIGARAGAIPEIVEEGKTGLTFPPGDAECLAEAIMMLAGDREKGQRFGENGFNRLVNEFHIARNIEATQRLYERILGAAS
ncbi:glycosyltransferase family 4 protein [Nitrospira sp. NS4]|uniref:glycosyltransferase family 4 protein n=1 Tax=Nitrospira sp. NS4 TaxID=3414498 RepID=UPI003C2CCB1E